LILMHANIRFMITRDYTQESGRTSRRHSSIEKLVNAEGAESPTQCRFRMITEALTKSPARKTIINPGPDQQPPGSLTIFA
jgi:hypothetical protein